MSTPKIWKGRGKVYLACKHVGHVSKVTQTIDTKVEDKLNLMRRNGGKLYSFASIDGVKFELTMDELYADVLAKMLQGTVTQVAAQVGGINLSVAGVVAGQRIPFGGYGTVTTVTVGGTAAVLGTDYTVSASGLTAIKPGAYEIDGDIVAHESYQPLSQSGQEFELSVELENDFDSTENGILLVHRWKPEPIKSMEWLQENASDFTWTGEALAKNDVAPGQSPFFSFLRQYAQ